MLKTIVSLATVLLAVAANKDVEHTVGNITVKVVGQSGKIIVGSSVDKTADVFLEVASLQEILADGSSGSNKVNSFAGKSFSFSSFNQANSYRGIDAASFSFSGGPLVDNNGTLKLEFYIFKADGVISVDGENTTVTVGSVKVNAVLDDWPYAANGAYVDLAVEIKGKGGTNSKAKADRRKNRKGQDTKGRKDRAFSLGGDATLVLSEKVVVDGAASYMPTGYPKLDQNNKKQTFTFRLPKGKQVVYDPVVDAAGVESSSTSSATAEKLSFAAFALLAAVGCL